MKLHALVLGCFIPFAAACLTPAQVVTINTDAQAAASIIATLAPVACAIVDTTNPSSAKAICQVVTNVSTGATELVPVVASLAALMQVVSVAPATPALQNAVAGMLASRNVDAGVGMSLKDGGVQ